MPYLCAIVSLPPRQYLQFPLVQVNLGKHNYIPKVKWGIPSNPLSGNWIKFHIQPAKRERCLWRPDERYLVHLIEACLKDSIHQIICGLVGRWQIPLFSCLLPFCRGPLKVQRRMCYLPLTPMPVFSFMNSMTRQFFPHLCVKRFSFLLFIWATMKPGRQESPAACWKHTQKWS